MRNGLFLACATMLLFLGQAQTASAQSGACRVRIDRTGGTGSRIQVPGGVHLFGNGGVLSSCAGQDIRMSSDSVALYSERDRLDLVDGVTFTDQTVTLVSDRATYHLSDQRLVATGNVTLTNRLTGSNLTGPNLTYLRAARGVRDSVELFADGRPTVHYRSVGAAADADPYVIVGDRLHMHGSSNAWAGGNVTIDRADFSSVSDSAKLDTNNESGELLGNALVAGGDSSDYTLTGRNIAYRTRNEQLEWIQARDSAVALGSEWRIEGDTVEFTLANSLVQLARAWGGAIKTNATADDYRITADSLEIDMPDQVLQELRGYVDAIAVSRADTSTTDADWVAGDTVTARFGETEVGGRALKSLEAVGNARALYKIYDEAGNGEPGINYSRGERVFATFGASGFENVVVVGEADGIFLEPIGSDP